VIVDPSAILIADDGGKVAHAAGMTLSVAIKTGSRRLLKHLLSPPVEITSRAMRQR
jgi:hypothetical protein